MRTNLCIVGLLFVLVMAGVLAIGARMAKVLRNPVIRDRPQPDHRLYSVGREDRREVKRWLNG